MNMLRPPLGSLQIRPALLPLTSVLSFASGRRHLSLRMDQSTSNFIIERVNKRSSGAAPLVVGLQGPQGSGKSTLSQALYDRLTAAPHSLRVAFLSLDDLYKTHKELQELERTHPTNKLLHGRGQPGTHDVQLGIQLLDQLKHINDSPSRQVQLPIYDKSLFDGQGDRVSQTRPVQGPLDVVIFEGWCTGFQASEDANILSNAHLQHTLLNPEALIRQTPPNKEHLKGPFFVQHELQSILEVNHCLKAYNALWDYIDCFIQIIPQDMSFTWTWRLQQEHAMKSKNGGLGMTDEQVENFVARYMPGYECFGAGIETRWKGALLRIVIDLQRQVADVQHL